MSPSRRFHHLLGLTAAIANHGMQSWFQRGDPDAGAHVFKALGDAWKKLFKTTKEKDVEEVFSCGISGHSPQSLHGKTKSQKCVFSMNNFGFIFHSNAFAFLPVVVFGHAFNPCPCLQWPL